MTAPDGSARRIHPSFPGAAMTALPKRLPLIVLGVLVAAGAWGAVKLLSPAWAARDDGPWPEVVTRRVGFQAQAPAGDLLDGGAAWLNTGGPIRLHDLRGKVVLLDFWTFCCINCHHVLPDLARLEEKYKDVLVVIGVHTPKFIAERDTANLRQKVREYRIKHPVVSDADMTIWNRFGVSSWPTLVLIDPEGQPVGSVSGEGHYDVLDRAIGALVATHRQKGDLNESPVKFFPENEKPDDTALLFPGKVLADAAGRRLFVADTGHNRLVQTDLEGKNPVAIGSGAAGLADGAFDRAGFNRPQGMALLGETLYVADTENHAIRAVDLKAKTVSTVAGTGRQAHSIARPGMSFDAREAALNSPWDLVKAPESRSLYIAMAGPHQIWRLDLDSGQVTAWAGTGMENITDGTTATAAFAQPSGLATDGTHLYVADSEVSAVRAITLGGGRHLVHSVVGRGLFDFGDQDGRGAAVRLQHCLGVAFGGGHLYVADTYNNKVKVCDPKTRAVHTLVGTGEPGSTNQPAEFYQPGGLSVAGSKLYVADTNNHLIRVVDLDRKTVATLTLDLTPPARPRSKPVFPFATKFAVKDAVKVAPGKALTLAVTVPIPDGYNLNDAEGATMPVLVETPGQEGVIDPAGLPETGVKHAPARQFSVNVPLTREFKAGDKLDLKVSVASFVCNEGSNFCTIKSYVWDVPVTFADGGTDKVAVGPPGQGL
jgi:YVTN family beta-propeller protein